MLNNALRQTGWKGPRVDESNWRSLVWRRVSSASSWERVIEDVRSFLERDADVALLTRENVARVLRVEASP